MAAFGEMMSLLDNQVLLLWYTQSYGSCSPSCFLKEQVSAWLL